MIGSRVQLSRVLDDLGSAVIEVLAVPTHLDPPVCDVTVYDAGDEQRFSPGELVLGVGVRTAADIAHLLGRLGPAQAAGLVVKTSDLIGDDLRAVACDSGVALLRLPRGARWLQVAALLHECVGPPGTAGADRTTDADPTGALGPTNDGDLFTVAHAVSTLLDAPVAIEDRAARVLAHAVPHTATAHRGSVERGADRVPVNDRPAPARPAPTPPAPTPPDPVEEADSGAEHTDEAWAAAILGRPAPTRYQRALEHQAVRQRLSAGSDPIYLPHLGDGITPRLAVAVRAGGEVLGFLWAAVREPPTRHRQRAFADAARVTALHLLARRAGTQVSRRLRADLLATLLEGGRGASEAANRLGLVGVPLSVVAAAPLAADGAAGEVTRRRLTDALALYLSALHPQAAAVLVAGISYAVVPLPVSEAHRPTGPADPQRGRPSRLDRAARPDRVNRRVDGVDRVAGADGFGTGGGAAGRADPGHPLGPVAPAGPAGQALPRGSAGPNGSTGSAGKVDDEYPVRMVREFLERAGEHDGTVVGVGGPATSLPGIARSRGEAERVLRVLRGGWNGKARPRVARLADLQLESLLLTLSDVLSEDDSPVSGPVATLLDYDARHQTKFIETVLTWLDTFGNVNEAAAAVHVHPNTFRYRLRRLCEISGLDLDDPDQRLAVMLQLRLHRLAKD